jgi:hypothetical protein
MNKLTYIHKKGHTLLEAVLYTAILTLLLFVMVNTFISIGHIYGTVHSVRSINSGAITMLDRLVYEIRRGESIVDAETIFGTILSSITLRTSANDISFEIVDGALTITETGGTGGSITSENVQVTAFVLERIVTGRGDGVKIALTLQSGTGRAERTKTFYTSAVLRGNY